MKTTLLEDKKNMTKVDILTRVELVNKTEHNTSNYGQAGKVALIGAFPTNNTEVKSFTNLTALRNKMGINPGTASEKQFDGARAAKRLFMEGITGYAGANTVTCINVTEGLTDTLQSTITVKVLDDENAEDSQTITNITQSTKLTMTKLKQALNKIIDESMDMIFISSDLNDAVDDTHTLKDVYTELVTYLNSRYSAQKPTYYIGALRCTDNISAGQQTGDEALVSNEINVLGVTDGEDNITSYGAKQICEIFANEDNELATAGLFYQGGVINGESVEPMELAAHICGWIASLKVSQDTTYQTIPALEGISEEAYFGTNDAGRLLNEFGVQVIKPKNRIQNTYCINNAIVPAGYVDGTDNDGTRWHTNHVRAVSYLLKQYAFEAGLGINNFTANIDSFKASLTSVTNNVLSNVDVIRDVNIGSIEVVEPYEIYVPIDIELAGVVTLIRVGVNMTIPDTTE